MNGFKRLISITTAASTLTLSAQAQLAQSDFSIDAEGWTTADNGGVAPVLIAGSITQQDTGPGQMAFVAPPAFLGDKGSAYRGTLSFEISTSKFPFAPSNPSVQVTGTTSQGPLSLELTLAPPLPAHAFNDYTINFSESKPWNVVGQARSPSALEFKEVLSSLTELRITCDSDADAGDYYWLDNVTMNAATVRVFILAGQSNMSGCDDVRNVDPIWQVPIERHMFYWDDQDPNPGFLALTTGSSTASCASSAPEFFFGPELGFGAEIAELYPHDRIAIIKYAVGGTNLYSQWTTPDNEFPDGGPMWNELLDTLTAAFGELGTLNHNYTIEAFLWMQGESDGDRRFRARDYDEKLTDFIAEIRAFLGEPEMPFILGRVRDAGQPYIEDVRIAQVTVADADPWACWFDTDDLNFLPDGIHYDEPGMLTLGQRFAERLYVFLDPRGDVNRDGVADVDDLYDWTQNPVDLNCDGVADQADMDIVVEAVRSGE